MSQVIIQEVVRALPLLTPCLPVVQVRVMVHGMETVLGDAASDHEIFMTNVHYECPASDAVRQCKATHLQVFVLRISLHCVSHLLIKAKSYILLLHTGSS